MPKNDEMNTNFGLHPNISKLQKSKNMSKEQKDEMLREASKPTVITNLTDLRMLINSLVERGNVDSINIETKIEYTDEQTRKRAIDNVSASINSTSLLDMLKSGMRLVKQRQESMAKISEAINKAKETDDTFDTAMRSWDVNNFKFNVDTIIERKLGGKRNGHRIKWVIPEGIYELDPFSMKLFRVGDKCQTDQ